VVAGFNVIVFTIITVLAHREKLQKKRKGQLPAPSHASAEEPSTPSVDDGNEKNLSVGVHAVNVKTG
jgi:ACS family pantothenate transporter-like MFS transporter